MTTPRIVVVGASLSGLRAAEALRRGGFEGTVSFVGAETHRPYNRPPLSKASDGKDPEYLRIGAGIGDAQWFLDDAATSCDLRRRVVVTASGRQVEFDGLIAATGVRPRDIGTAGPREGRHTLRTHDDARRMWAAAANAERVVIVGAGFIGCEVAAVLARSGVQVAIVAPETVPIQRVLGDEVGGELRRRLERAGVTFHLATKPAHYDGPGRVSEVVTDNSAVLPCDFVVEATGSVPNVEWLDGNGLDLDDGIRCDESLRTTEFDRVVACGDVVRFPHPLDPGVARRIEHWAQAVDTGKTAGRSLAASFQDDHPATEPCRTLPSFWSHQGDIRIQSFGLPALADAVTVAEGSLDGDFAAVYTRSGRHVGSVLFGLTARYQFYRSLVEQQLAADSAA